MLRQYNKKKLASSFPLTLVTSVTTGPRKILPKGITHPRECTATRQLMTGNDSVVLHIRHMFIICVVTVKCRKIKYK